MYSEGTHAFPRASVASSFFLASKMPVVHIFKSTRRTNNFYVKVEANEFLDAHNLPMVIPTAKVFMELFTVLFDFIQY